MMWLIISVVIVLVMLFLFLGVPSLMSGKPVPPKADPEKIRIVCMGDSITYGMGVLYGGRVRRVWTTLSGIL